MKTKYNLIAILFIMIILIIPVFSEATTGIKLTLSTKDKVNLNEEIEVKVISKGEKNTIQGIQGILKFDNSVFEYKGKKSLNNNLMITGFNIETGKFLLELSDEALQNGGIEISEGEELCSFSFKVKESSSITDTSMTLTEILAVGYGQVENDEVKISIIKKMDNVPNNTNNDTTDIPNNNTNNETDNTANDIKKEETIVNSIYPKAGKINKKNYIGISFLCMVSTFCYFWLKRYKGI